MKQTELKVFISNRESVCDECHENLGTQAWIFLNGEKGALCLSCADLDHLDFLPSGNMALTRRAKKISSLCAVVLKWNGSRKHYERQGLLVQPEALEKAEVDCLKDEDARLRRRSREAELRKHVDQNYVTQFAERIRDRYPGCPANKEKEIAEHACQKYSGRVGRSSAAKTFDENTIKLAVIAHIRHVLTNYDELLSKGWERFEARESVNEKVSNILSAWQA